MAWIAVARLDERCRDIGAAPRCQDPLHFAECECWFAEVLEDGFAVDCVNGVVCIGKRVGIGDDVDVREEIDVQIGQCWMRSAWAASNRQAESKREHSLGYLEERIGGLRCAVVALDVEKPPGCRAQSGLGFEILPIHRAVCNVVVSVRLCTRAAQNRNPTYNGVPGASRCHQFPRPWLEPLPRERTDQTALFELDGDGEHRAWGVCSDRWRIQRSRGLLL
jgi:hypothetical protein